jgi:hypothetical protein
MHELISFKYRDFYDVPRLIAVECQGQLILLDSPFDESKDEYSDFYTVFLLPADVRVPESGSWEHLISEALRKLGTVRVGEMAFDSTRRKALDPAPLFRFLAQRGDE